MMRTTTMWNQQRICLKILTRKLSNINSSVYDLYPRSSIFSALERKQQQQQRNSKIHFVAKNQHFVLPGRAGAGVGGVGGWGNPVAVVAAAAAAAVPTPVANLGNLHQPTLPITTKPYSYYSTIVGGGGSGSGGGGNDGSGNIKDYDQILVDMTHGNTTTRGRRRQQPNLNSINDLLQKIERQRDVKLKEKTFFVMVKSCASVKNQQAAEAAEIIVMKWLIEFHRQGRLDNAPNENIFGVVIQAWVNTKHPNAGRRAQQLLEDMESLVQQGVLPFTLNTKIYNKVIKAYAMNGDIENAQLIFEKCMKDFEDGNENARPNVIVWSTLLDACAKSRKIDSWKIAEDIFNKMQKSYQSGVLKELPDTICYNSLIDSCAKSKQPQRCEKILQRMIKLAKEGTLPVLPNTISYNSVINAHAKSNQPQKAEHWLQAMFEDYKRGNASAKPDVLSFSTVLDAWAREGTEDGAQRCEYILNCMKELSAEGKLPLRPNTISYNSVINSWAVLGNPQKARLAFDNMLEDYKQGNRNAKPNAVSCKTLLKAFRESGLRDAGEMADSVLEEMEELRIVPDADVFVLAKHCWQRSSRSGHPKAGERIKELDKTINEF